MPRQFVGPLCVSLPPGRRSHSLLKCRHFLAGPLTLGLPELLSLTLVSLEAAEVMKGLAESAFQGTQIGALPT